MLHIRGKSSYQYREMDQQLVSCILCNNEYDIDKYLPKILNCGHTICLECVKQSQGNNSIRCCKKQNIQSIQQLKTNAFLLNLIQQQQLKNSSQNKADSQKYVDKIQQIQLNLRNVQLRLESEKTNALCSILQRIEATEKRAKDQQIQDELQFQNFDLSLQNFNQSVQNKKQKISQLKQALKEQSDFNQEIQDKNQTQWLTIKLLEQKLMDFIQNSSNNQIQLNIEIQQLNQEKEQIQQNLSNKINEILNKSERKKSKLSLAKQKVEEFDTQIQELQRKLENQLSSNQDLDSKFQIAQVELSQYKEQNQNLQLQMQKKEKQIQELKDYKAQISELENQVQNEQSQSQLLKSELDNIKMINKKLETNFDFTQNENKDLKQEIENLNNQISQLREKSQLQKNQENSALVQKDQEINELNEQIQQLNQDIKRLQNQDVIQKKQHEFKLEESQEQIKNLEQEKQKQTEAIDKQRQEIIKIKAELQKSQHFVQQNEEFEKQIQDLQDQLKNKEKQLQLEKEENERNQNEIKQLYSTQKSDLSQQHKQKIQELQKQILTQQEQNLQLQQEINAQNLQNEQNRKLLNQAKLQKNNEKEQHEQTKKLLQEKELSLEEFMQNRLKEKEKLINTENELNKEKQNNVQLKWQLEQAENEIKQTSTKLQSFQVNQKNEVQKLKNTYDELEKLKETINNLKNELYQNQNLLQMKQQENSKLEKDYWELKQENIKQKNYIEDLNLQKEQLQQTLEEERKEVEPLHNDLKIHLIQNGKLTKELEHYKQLASKYQVENDRAHSSTLLDQIQDLEQQNLDLKDKLNKIKICNEELQKYKQLSIELQQENDLMKEQMLDQEDKDKRFQNMQNQLKNLNIMISGKDSIIEDFEDKLNVANQTLQMKEKLIQELQKFKLNCKCQQPSSEDPQPQQKANQADRKQSVLIKPGQITRQLTQVPQIAQQSPAHSQSNTPRSATTGTINSEINEDVTVQEEKERFLQNNMLLTSVQNLQGEKPMSFANIFKLFEQLLDAKFKQDSEDLAAKIKPRNMNNFLFDYLLQQYGVRALANKSLAQLLMGLNQLYKEGSEYGILFCRMIQVYHPSPIDLILSTFLTKIRIEFNKFSETHARKKATEQQKNPNKTKEALAQAKTTYGKMKYDLEACGGEAPIMEILNLIMQIFEKNKLYANQVCHLLYPKQNRNEFLMYLITQRVIKISKTPSQMFDTMDVQNLGSLGTNEFKDLLAQNLGLQLTEEEAQLLAKYIDEDNTGMIGKEQFIEKIQQIMNQKVPKDQ